MTNSFNYLTKIVSQIYDEWQKIRPIKPMKDEKKSINYLKTWGIKQLLEHPDNTTGIGRMNLALQVLMYDSARVQEMVNLTPESLKIETTPYTIRLFGKG